MKTKSLNAKKQLERIISCKVSEGFYKDGNKVYESALTEDELRKRAARIDRTLFNPNRKEMGGLNTQKAMLFIMQHKPILQSIRIVPTDSRDRNSMRGMWHTWKAMTEDKFLEYVDITPSDFDYAKSIMRLS